MSATAFDGAYGATLLRQREHIQCLPVGGLVYVGVAVQQREGSEPALWNTAEVFLVFGWICRIFRGPIGVLSLGDFRMKQHKQGKHMRRAPKFSKDISPKQLEELAGRVRYEPSPRHKKNPVEYGLTPLGDKGTPCERSSAFKSGTPIAKLKKAKTLLKRGVKMGLVSKQWEGDFPSAIWAVTDDGEPFEARLENREQGTYHGFPLLDDPVGNVVVDEVAARASSK